MPLFRAGRTAAAAAIIGMLATPAFAQKKDDKKDKSQKSADQTKFTDAQRQELLPVIRTVDEVMKSGTAGTFNVTTAKDCADGANCSRRHRDVQLVWRNDYLKATNQLIYVPFIISVDPPKGPARGAPRGRCRRPRPAAGARPTSPKMSSSIVAYLRVAPKGATGRACRNRRLPLPRQGQQRQ